MVALQGPARTVSLRQHVDDLATRAKAHGVALDSEPPGVWRARVFRLRDPDGFRLVISSEPSPGS